MSPKRPRRTAAAGLSLASTCLAASAFGALWTAGCGDGTKASDTKKQYGLTAAEGAEVLVRIGEREITVAEFAARLAAESPYLRPRYNNPENRKDYLRNWVDFELLALEAKRRGLDKLPEIERSREQRIVAAYLEDRVYKQIRPEQVTEDAIRRHYEENPGEYRQPEQRRAEHLLVGDRSSAAHLLERLKESSDQESTFREFVGRFSMDASTRERFGDLRFFSQNPDDDSLGSLIPAAVRDAAFSLQEVGDIYPEPVASPAGFHLVRLRAIRPALDRSLEDARHIIQSRLLRERREAAVDALVADLRRHAQVEINEDVLSSLTTSLPPHAGEQGTEEATSISDAPAIPPPPETILDAINAQQRQAGAP